MGFVDKIKNALFEVEYVEVDKQDKEIKDNNKKIEDNKDKPIAKKVILSGHKRNTNQENIQLNKEEIEKKQEPEETLPPIPETKVNDFKVMNDNDFKVEDEYKINAPVEKTQEPVTYHDTYDDNKTNSFSANTTSNDIENRVIYRQEIRTKAPYGIDTTSRNLVQNYGGAYEKKDEKTGFKPSPIISPIYGVLDKNYKKEDVKEKKDVRVSSYTRENVNVDDVRNKAYGDIEKEQEKEKEKERERERAKELERERVKERFNQHEEKKPNIEEDDEDDSDLLVDLSKDDDKPSIKEVTMGDALEYFQDLGLEYNVDYMDASKEKATGRRVKDNYNEQPELFAIATEDEEKTKQEQPFIQKDDNSQINEDVFGKMQNKEEPTKESDNEIDVENDDNLFDLIDSMYDEEK